MGGGSTGLRTSKQNAFGTTAAQYTAAPGGYGPTVAQRRGTTSSFYHPTDLGTIENLTDAPGNVTDCYVFTAFGVPVAATGSTTNPHRYIGALGYYTDPATGLSYVRARYLRPTTGSWLSVDPVQGEPRYGYVDACVASVSDASGLGGLRDVLLAQYERLRRAVQRSNTHIRPPLVGDPPPRPRLRPSREGRALEELSDGLEEQDDFGKTTAQVEEMIKSMHQAHQRRMEGARNVVRQPEPILPPRAGQDHPIGGIVAPPFPAGPGAGGVLPPPTPGYNPLGGCASAFPDARSSERIICEGCAAIINGFVDTPIALQQLMLYECITMSAHKFFGDLDRGTRTCIDEGHSGGDCIDCCARELADDNDRTRCEQKCFAAGLG